MPDLRQPCLLAVAALLLLLLTPAAHADFPPITDAEKALTKVPGEPGAPAVVLFHSGSFRMQDLAATQEESRLVIRKRVKILTQAGLEHAEIALPHSSFHRLVRLEGRTVLPDGRVIPLARDEKFQRRVSRLDSLYVTVAAFPAVEVGAILDLELELRFDSLLFVEPWLFQDRIPTLHSEIVFDVPDRMGFNVWARESQPGSLKISNEKSTIGTRVRASVDNAFPIPAEPFSVPLSDLASRITILPTVVVMSGESLSLLSDWESTYGLLKEHYDRVLSGDREVKRRAKEIAAKKPGDPRVTAETLYRLVRDEVATEPGLGALECATEAPVDKILAEGKSWSACKALLLYALLDAAKLKPALVWAVDRVNGQPDLETPNLDWFDRMLVHVELRGESVYLDPNDPRLGFGQLAPGYDGGRALLLDTRKPKAITLPAIPAAASLLRARIEIELDATGRLRGSGTASFAEHAAFAAMQLQDEAADPETFWQKELERGFGDLAVRELSVERKVDERRLEVRFGLEQHEEDVLDDEASVSPSRPFSRKQPFALPPEKRQTPVVLPYLRREEVELELRWPEGWELVSTPPPVMHSGPAGTLETRVESDPAARRLHAIRHFETTRREHSGTEAYRILRDLHLAVEKNDVQALALVRR